MINNKTKPEKLYESCGFEDKILWHILMEKDTNSPPEYIENLVSVSVDIAI